jgi:TonB family protein
MRALRLAPAALSVLAFAAAGFGSKTFKTPVPIPNLVGGTHDDATAALGAPGTLVTGSAAVAACKGSCDEIDVYGPASAKDPAVTTASTFVYFKKGKIRTVKWVFPGHVDKADDFPELKTIFAGLRVPIDAEAISATTPVTVEGVSDNMDRVIRWNDHGYQWTARVMCPLVREFDTHTGQRGSLRKALMEEYRVVAVESGPARLEYTHAPCSKDPAAPPLALFATSPDLPRATSSPRPNYPPEQDVNGFAGVVIVQYVVGTDGKVQSASVVRGHPGFELNALDAIKRWRFGTYVCDGSPIRWTSRTAFYFDAAGP